MRESRREEGFSEKERLIELINDFKSFQKEILEKYENQDEKISKIENKLTEIETLLRNGFSDQIRDIKGQFKIIWVFLSSVILALGGLAFRDFLMK